MELFLQQILTGIANGAIYSCLALAVVMTYKAMDHLNFAQGEMAMFSTYICWAMISIGIPYWIAFLLTIIVSFSAGVAIERIIFKPIHNASILSHIVVFIGLLAIFNSLAGAIWGHTIKTFPSPFPEGSFQGLIGLHEVGMFFVTLIVLGAIFCFFKYTRVGMAMQAAAANPDSAALVGIRVGWMLALGWGLAAAIGAVAGMMIAPIVFLDPNMMLGILLYGFAAAVVGGITSPGGAVAGGFLVGIIENLAGTYIPAIGSELKLTVALVLIVTTLLFKPNGLFGKSIVTRV
jgi:branched-chain amino acid transport system permease protein